jgi:hypothetical protein
MYDAIDVVLISAGHRRHVLHIASVVIGERAPEPSTVLTPLYHIVAYVASSSVGSYPGTKAVSICRHKAIVDMRVIMYAAL